MQIKSNRSALSSAQLLSAILVVALMLVALAYIGTVETNSSQISSLQSQVNNLEEQVKNGQTNLTSLQGNLTGLRSSISSLPVMHQEPTVRNIKVEWVNSLNAQQDRFFLPTITVNQGDTLDITFISNDSDAHTFTLESPYDFQINATVPGTLDYLANDAVFTTNATNNSPGVKVWGTPGNVSGSGSFVAKYAGIYEYFCVYHVALGMFGYLIVLPNAAASGQPSSSGSGSSTSATGSKVQMSIVQGASTNTNAAGFVPSTVLVVLGVNNTVAWTNKDSAPHTVTSNNGTFSSGNLNPGDTFSWTFTSPGVYYYHCSYHPWMQAVVIVRSS